MAPQAGERRAPSAALLHGSGRRAREVARVCAALSELDLEGARRREGLPEAALGDMEELLAPRAPEGLLVLESARIPGEDIGFVRRFLERHPGWRLLVLADDAGEARAKGLLALRRAQWLPWPPNLEELRALIAPLGAGAALGGEPRAEARASEPRAPNGPADERARKPARRTNAGNGTVDLGELLEELLAGAALQGEGTARFQLRAGERVLVQRERAALQEGLAGLVELARVCAGHDGLVQATLVPNGDAVRIRLDFPRAALAELEPPALLAGGGPELATPWSEGLAAARAGAELLRAAGGRVELTSGEPGRLRCEVRLPGPAGVSPRAPRAGKAEDPFA
jgi:hypothetical protein